jgi:copper chaperone CopZ
VTKFNVSGLTNTSDIESVRGAVQSMEGVHAVRVDNVANTITVEYEDNVSKEKLSSTINRFKSSRTTQNRF